VAKEQRQKIAHRQQRGKGSWHVRMSTVTVTHGLRSLRIKATPGTLAGELLERAVTHFKLDSAAANGLL
jgi:hypothetical protein